MIGDKLEGAENKSFGSFFFFNYFFGPQFLWVQQLQILGINAIFLWNPLHRFCCTKINKELIIIGPLDRREDG